MSVGHEEDEVDECGSQQLTKRPTQSLLVHVQEPDEPQLLHHLETRHMNMCEILSSLSHISLCPFKEFKKEVNGFGNYLIYVFSF